MSDEVQRCPCGGTFVYSAGKWKCPRCNAVLYSGVTTPPSETFDPVGKTLGEVLAHYRRGSRRGAWVPRDEDVRVTADAPMQPRKRQPGENPSS